MQEKVSVRFWLIGVGVFLVVIAVSSLIEQSGATFGIVDHQSAGSAERVNEIQAQWHEQGVHGHAIAAMAFDLGWIWIYALGSFVAGRGFATKHQGILGTIGLLICGAAVVFAITDYAETISQFIQLLRESGSDTLAGVAAVMQPIKMLAFVVTFLGVVFAAAFERYGPHKASAKG